MALPSYATSADLAGWDTDVYTPAYRERLLRSASLLVAKAVQYTAYDATDQAVIDALRDATVAQATGWIAAGIDPADQGIVTSGASPVRRREIGTLQIEYDTSSAASVTAMKTRQQAISELNDEARTILDLAGLLRAGYTVTG